MNEAELRILWNREFGFTEEEIQEGLKADPPKSLEVEQKKLDVIRRLGDMTAEEVRKLWMEESGYDEEEIKIHNECDPIISKEEEVKNFKACCHIKMIDMSWLGPTMNEIYIENGIALDASHKPMTCIRCRKVVRYEGDDAVCDCQRIVGWCSETWE